MYNILSRDFLSFFKKKECLRVSFKNSMDKKVIFINISEFEYYMLDIAGDHFISDKSFKLFMKTSAKNDSYGQNIDIAHFKTKEEAIKAKKFIENKLYSNFEYILTMLIKISLFMFLINNIFFNFFPKTTIYAPTDAEKVAQQQLEKELASLHTLASEVKMLSGIQKKKLQEGMEPLSANQNNGDAMIKEFGK